jgi:hypothetical protein
LAGKGAACHGRNPALVPAPGISGVVFARIDRLKPAALGILKVKAALVHFELHAAVL